MIKKILIIKLGFSETFNDKIDRVVSLGDVLRTTPLIYAILEKYPLSELTWLVSGEAYELIIGIPLLSKVIVWEEQIVKNNFCNYYDVIINLEKDVRICLLVKQLNASENYGFYYDTNLKDVKMNSKSISSIDNYFASKQNITEKLEYWQKKLVEIIGVGWKEQPYLVNTKYVNEPKFDIGLNYTVGSKWPSKAMSVKRWDKLYQRLSVCGFSISYQKGMDNLKSYMSWLSSCRLIITQDSLGLHLAIAMKRDVIGLFGPTSSKEIYFYKMGKAIIPEFFCDIMPCYQSNCLKEKHCMEFIDIEKIVEVVTCYFSEENN